LDVVTIVGSNYLAYAEALLVSVHEHHPDARRVIVVVDVDDRETIATSHEVMTLADLGLDPLEVQHRRAIYTLLELATSVKAAALSALLVRGAATAVYLDPDIVLYRPLIDLEAMASTHQIVLTPHLLRPLEMDGRNLTELQILVAGVFNLGFIAVSPDARPFLQFWGERLRRHCRIDPEHGLFVDQRWVDQVPALFQHTVVRDSGWNVAYWNLHERPLARLDDGTILAGDRPLVFFHFSGHDPLDGVLLSRYQAPAPRILLSQYPLVADLCRAWREQVLANGHAELVQAESPGMTALELTPDEAVVSSHSRMQQVLDEHPTPGLNVVGYFESVLGVGEAGRRIVLAAEAAGLPVATSTERRTNSAQIHAFRTRDHRLLPFDTTVFAVNADRIVHALADHGGPSARASRRTVGFCAWEVDRLANGMEPAFDMIDELWVHSRYVQDIFRAYTDLPVRRFPIPVLWPTAPTNLRRADLDLPEDRFLFLFMFDFFSVVARKNPLGLVEAYRQAFSPDDGVGLVLKSVNGDSGLLQVAELERLRLSTADRPDVEVRDGYLGPHETRALFELCDAYASLHRAEGFGLTIAEAMAAGKPVIATGFSGNLDFMDSATAHLVPYELVEVGAGADRYPADAVWAEPNLDAAAALMQALVDDRDAGARLGAAARQQILERNGLRPAAEFLAAQILGNTAGTTA
jgi:glycosyltransferase involved in cell wall biosynthesis